MEFVLSGNLRIGNRTEKFSRSVDAKTEVEAKERLLSLFGSEHGAKRREVAIDKVEKKSG